MYIGTSVHGMLKPNISTWREKKLFTLMEGVCSSPIGDVDPKVTIAIRAQMIKYKL